MSKQSTTLEKEILRPRQTASLSFQTLNNSIGWTVFAIATLVYLLTVERTASFWDCGEFIACSYKLQVPHPPGAPFFLLIGRMFSMLAFGDVTQVAYWINVSSVLCSSFTILFLFWSITRLGIKLYPNRNIDELSDFQIITLMGAGTVGALAYTFSDSFWFSAVEAEVYAMSSFFTAFVFWAMLKWELIEDESKANKWFILIAYITGLSIGVHLLNLVVLPAMGLLYYYKKFTKPTPLGVFVTLLASGAIIILIMEGVIPGLPSMAGKFEIFFVNTLGLPFGSGALTFVVLFLGALIYGIYYSIQKEFIVLNTALLCFTYILIGYASYGIVVIRAGYNPPINENDPSDIIKFVSYLKREQYGDRPLLYGPTFASDVKRDSDGYPIQISKGKLYRVNAKKGNYEPYMERFVYDYEDKMLLPRIYSRSEDHPRLYMEQIYGSREVPEDYKPKMKDNLYFMFKYQFGHMYFRYFLWNFVGRDGDIEGAGALTGLESAKDLPKERTENKARNNFYALPFILGLLGFAFMTLRSQQTLFVTVMLFVLTGLALVVYLNSPPVEPRERDYIYAGSFYAFAMWIGFGVMFLTDLLQKVFKQSTLAPIVATVLSLSVPGIMAAQGWDDHNRSNRYHSIDSAKNLLNSCAPNAILFTGGDNDTFPLWYVQEVEGFRTDVRVCNLSLLGTDWYIKQMKRPAYESKALPLSINDEQYLSGRNDQIFYYKHWQLTPNLSSEDLAALEKNGMDLKVFIDLVAKGDKSIKTLFGLKKEEITVLPSQRFVYRFDKEKVLKMGFVPKAKDTLVTGAMAWELKANDFLKSELAMLDMIVTNEWKRPIYFSTTLGGSSYLNLREYMQLEGLAFRLMPYKVTGATNGTANTDLMYANMMPAELGGKGDGKKTGFFYRELDNEKVYYDENYSRFTANLRGQFARMCDELLKEGKKEQARKAALFILERIPHKVIPFDYYVPRLASVLYKVGESKKATEVTKIVAESAIDNLAFYTNDSNKFEMYRYSIGSNLQMLEDMINVLEEQNKNEEAKKYRQRYDQFYNRLR